MVVSGLVTSSAPLSVALERTHSKQRRHLTQQRLLSLMVVFFNRIGQPLVSIFVLAQILIKLAVEEPGPNWIDETYTHSRDEPNILGWLLPESWTRNDENLEGEVGPRRSGILGLRYTTDEVRAGCDCCDDQEGVRGEDLLSESLALVLHFDVNG